MRRWQQLYARAERAARAFFAQHFGEVCARCCDASRQRRDPTFNCCRRTNFLPDIITSPLLGGLVQESLGHSLLVLSGPHNEPECAALGPTGCRIPLGRPEACNAYVCDHIHRCAASGLPPGMMYRVQQALEVFHAIESAPRWNDSEYHECVAGVTALEELLAEASRRLCEQAPAFTERKAEVIFAIFPPSG